MPPSSEPSLTFGVEIECGVRVSRSLLKKMVEHYRGGPDPCRGALIYHVTGELKKAGIPVHRHEKSIGEIKPDDFSRWFVDGDRTIDLPERLDDRGNAYIFFSIELVSRILPLNDLDYVSDTHPPVFSKPREGIDEVVRVLKVLEDSPVTFFTNESCGLHFHIALKPSKHSPRFSSETLRIFSGLVTAVENPIDSIVASHRMCNNHCPAPSHTPGLYSKDVFSRLAMIQSKVHSKDIIEFMNPHCSRRHAYNFQNLLPDGNRKTALPSNTIEFRQHEGTLDPAAATAFLQVAAGLVRLAFYPSTEKRYTAWAEHADRGAFTITDLLRKMNKSHLIGFYALKERPIFGDDSDDDSDYAVEPYPSSCYPVSPCEEEPPKKGMAETVTGLGQPRERAQKQHARPRSPVRRSRRPSAVGRVLNLLRPRKNKDKKVARSLKGGERLVIE